MANPITWHNVTQSDWSNDGSANAALVANSLGGIGDTLRTAHEDKSKRLTGEAKAFISSLTDPQAMARQVADYSAGMDKRYVDMGQMADFQQGHRTAVLNQDAKAFENEHAPERLEAALASSRAYARTANQGADKADRMQMDRQKSRELFQKIPRLEDGSPNLPVLNAAAAEMNIHPDAFALELTASNNNTGYSGKLAKEELLAERAHKIKEKKTKAFDSKGAAGNMDKNAWIRRHIKNDGGGLVEKTAWKKMMIVQGHDASIVNAAADGGDVSGSVFGLGGDEWSESQSKGVMETLEEDKVQRAAEALRKGQ